MFVKEKNKKLLEENVKEFQDRAWFPKEILEKFASGTPEGIVDLTPQGIPSGNPGETFDGNLYEISKESGKTPLRSAD